MIKICLIFSFSIWLATAVEIKSSCPDSKPVDNFEMDAYAEGKWYEIARYYNDVEKKGDCGFTTFRKNNGTYEFTLTEVLDGKLNIIKYNAVPSPNKTGKIVSHSLLEEVDEVNHTFPVNIVAIDYNKYAVGFQCIYFEETKMSHEYAWIQSRTKTLEGSVKEAVFDFIKSSGYIDVNRFEWEHFTEEFCTVAN